MPSVDTAVWAEKAQIDLLRRASGAQRASLALSLSQMTQELTRRAIAKAHPTADADELAVRFVAACYGEPLAAELRSYLNEHHGDKRL